ncbi:hypothetical protein Glove_168g310 [Diversispora epigaea]|uniref:F-box/LRR-repeat protein 15-like leucin rich repeat domain-containing protein n=1 Tax=Diversispora epigaea TaxID=1348612 RepID=A0A397IPU7_9GLOM|nr:hypothetical protein Glove_168g310 [Diversispora epigaea]
MLSEIKENGISTSNDASRLSAEVTHLEFVGDRTSTSGKDITLLEEFLASACKEQKTSYSSSLRSLKITHYSKLSDKKILYILRSYPNITNLNFEQSGGFTDASLIVIARLCPNLESLNICGNQGITGHPIYKIAQSCQKLRHLDIGFCGNITDDFVYKIVKANCKLELLCIGGLKRHKPISDRTIIAIASSCPNLHHLSLMGCHNITDNSVNKLLQHIHNLEYLELDQCRLITDLSIRSVANSCPNLEHLDIGACDASETSICNIVRSCKKLKYLNIRCCRLVTDKVISEIVQHCSNLEYLSIVGTTVSKDALRKLSPKIKIKQDSALEKTPEEELNDLRTSLVYLAQNLWLTYANLEDIVQYCEDKIKDEHYQKSIVELERDMRGTAESLGLMVRIVANSCPNLEHLDIGACDASETSICNIVRSCKKLKYLNIRCCRLVTDKVISEIVQHCSNLEYLSIVGTTVSKDALRKLSPKIKIKQDSALEKTPEEELNDLRTSLVYLAQNLWLTYANLEDIVQYCEDKIKDEHYQKSIVELERDMRGTAESLGLMVRMYGLKEKINYQPTRPEYDTSHY